MWINVDLWSGGVRSTTTCLCTAPEYTLPASRDQQRDRIVSHQSESALSATSQSALSVFPAFFAVLRAEQSNNSIPIIGLELGLLTKKT